MGDLDRQPAVERAGRGCSLVALALLAVAVATFFFVGLHPAVGLVLIVVGTGLALIDWAARDPWP